MVPARKNGYVIAGTHVFSLPDIEGHRIAVFVDVPDAVIASRLTGAPVDPLRVDQVISDHLDDNPVPLRVLQARADLVIDGTRPHDEQVESLRAFLE